MIPGTDRSFAGFELPHWSGVKELAVRTAGAFPRAHAIGWDIAITESGPVLVEGNKPPQETHDRPGSADHHW